jgi:hypothetical protein
MLTIKSYRVRMPIRKDVKHWIACWLGKNAETLVLDVVSEKISEIHAPILLALSRENPAEQDAHKDLLVNNKDTLSLVLPVDRYLSQEKLVRLEEVWYQYMISQIATVCMARKEINLVTARSDVYDAYRRIFDIDMSDNSLNTAIRRCMSRRNLKKFMVFSRSV